MRGASLEKEDFHENLHILSCFVQLKGVLFNLLCVLDLVMNVQIRTLTLPKISQLSSGWLQVCHPWTYTSSAQLSSKMGLSMAHIPQEVICCLEVWQPDNTF